MQIGRRKLLQIGPLSLFGSAALSHAVRADSSAPRPLSQPAPSSFGRAKACVFLMLQGGPSHHDLWDPKPLAPDQIRGPFTTIETANPACRFGELLVETAKWADRLTVVRSMEHAFANHIAGTYITLTGSSDQPDADREAKAADFPGPGAVLNYLRAGDEAAVKAPPSVSLPTWLSIPGPSNRMPGQYAGMLGPVHDPFLIAGEPHKPDFKPLCLSLPAECGDARLASRRGLLERMDQEARRIETGSTRTADRFRESAYEMLTDPRVRQAVDLGQEPDAVRERYGKTKIGQSLLLARRLIEAGVTLVGYNAFNQEWDTHGGLSGRYQKLVPPMDRAYAALLSDLEDRGLLDQTLVVNAGEFGRTPLVNQDAGRDHWPHAYSVALAGGGVHQGLVYGQSDGKGAFVADRPVSPADLLATLWHLLGIDPATELRDTLGRPIRLSHGRVVEALLG